MARILRKRKVTETQQIREEITTKTKKKKKLKYPKRVISTGSTLLDLACYGTKVRGGGVPGGIVVEIFGPPSSGKTAILVEMGTSAQIRGGDVRFDDPEARLDREYARLYGLKLPRKKYTRSNTVNEMFGKLWNWEPKSKNPKAINVSCADSLAALSTEIEMTSEDKMGMKRAKDFSAGLRKSARLIANNNWIIACTNQEREGTGGGIVTPGGRGIPYYASLRIRITPMFQKWRVIKKKKIGNKEIENQIGILSSCEVRKSSIDNPYRKAPVYIIFGHGIDDIRANLQWCKDMTGNTKYHCINKDWGAMDKAIQYIEDNELEANLREKTIDLWEEIQDNFKPDRKRKARF